MKRLLNLRTLLVVLMALTAIITLLGGVGSTCVAFNAEQYPGFKSLAPYKSILQILVYLSVLTAVAMIVVTYWTARASQWFYIGALITLLIGGGAAAVQMYYSSSVRGISFFAAAPTNVRLYITIATLIVFAIVRLPGLWNKVGQGSNERGNLGTPTGLALIVAGATMLSAPWWASPEHISEGINYVETLAVPLTIDGLAMILAGGLLLSAQRWLTIVKKKWLVVSG